MKANQSLTAAITAAALVAGAGFAYAQTSSPTVTNTPSDSSAQGPITQNQGTTGSGTSGSTMQAQPSGSTGSSVDSSTSGSMSNSATTDTGTLGPRADRN